MTTLTPEDRARLRDRAAKPTPGPWVPVDPATVTALLDALDAAEAERDEARAGLAAIRARDEEACTDEGWWIGGAWGDYGEAVVPLRILSYVVGGELDQKVADLDPGFALTYAEQVARADAAEGAVQRVRALHVRVPYADAPEYGYCGRCQRGGAAGVWPCETLRALDGDA